MRTVNPADDPKPHKRIIHLDMDAFYASVEIRDDPSLRGKPVIVAGRSPRSVVTTASYEARRFGVRSAMPVVEAVRRCPQGLLVEPRMGVYSKVSAEVMKILSDFSPLVEPLSLDEAFVDVSASELLFGPAPSIAAQMRERIRSELSLTASAGVASSKFVAKIASDLHKPDGLTVVAEGEEAAFLAPLPVERMWGVGPKAAARLHAHGIRTIGELAQASPSHLARVLSNSWGREIALLAKGLDPREVVVARAARSIGAEETFERDFTLVSELEPFILGQAARVAQRLLEERLVCRTVTLKVKFGDHKLVTRQAALSAAACDTLTLYEAARSLLTRIEGLERGVRLTGIQASALESEAREQRTLFQSAASDKRRLLEKTLLGVREKFGDGAVQQARMMERGKRR